MSLASILLHVEVDPAAEPRLRLAADLANQFDARLVGVGGEFFEPASAAAAVGYVDAETPVAEARVVQDDIRLAQARFAEAAGTVRAGSEWRAGVGLPAEMIIQQARVADLIVCGPRRADHWGLHAHADPGEVMMGAGRPVLVVPPGLAKLDASSILVAWKDSRESRRAVADALPFLKRAGEVLVVEVCEQGDGKEAAIGVADVAAYLARHGVKAATEVRKPDRGSAASAIFQAAETRNAGLIVAGGYGHTRLGEWIFGGVTQDLLAGSQRAVLLSH